MAKYRIGDPIASGGQCEVHEARCTDDGWEGVAKRLPRGADAERTSRFRREVKLLAQLSHPGVITVRGYKLDCEQPWYAMERATSNLREFLETNGPGGNSIKIWRDAAVGVEHAHQNGVLHRDIKPENILVFEVDDLFEEEIGVVADFGMGRHIDRQTMTLTGSSSAVGTLAYNAPEQLMDPHTVDERADVYGLGKVLAEVLTGVCSPFSSLDIMTVPDQFRYVVQRATDANLDRRYPTVTALLADFEQLTRGRHELERPEERLIQIFDRVSHIAAKARKSDVEGVMQILLGELRNPRLLMRVLPKMPRPMLRSILDTRIDAFLPVLEVYDDAVEGGVTYEYCDAIADFYEVIYNLTQDSRVRSRIMRRLAVLGPENNRYYVGRTFARLLTATTDGGLLLDLRDHLQTNSQAASWLTEYVTDVPAVLQPLLRP